MLSPSSGRAPGLLTKSGVCRFGRNDLLSRSRIYTYITHRYGARYLTSVSGLPFGDLYRPSSSQDRAIQFQIADRVPFDMIDEWKERNEIDFRQRLSHMPEQFAEASQRYSTDQKDHLLASLLRHCTKNKLKRRNEVERSRFMASLTESTYDVMDRLLACECGILLKCFLKLEHRDYGLQRALIERMLQRGQVFSAHASVAALNTILLGMSDHPRSQWNIQREDTSRLRRRLLTQIQGNLDKFTMVTLAKLTNSISRTSLDVTGLLRSIKDRIFELHVESGDSYWSEEVVHFLANGFSRKGIYDKPLFDLLKDEILVSCPGYTIDTLVSLCNAYSKFGSAEDSNYIELFTRLADEILLKRRQLTNRHTCVLANAFAMCCINHEHLLEVLDDAFVFNIDCYDSRQIAMIIHAFSRLSYRSKNHLFIWQKCTENLQSYSWQGLTMIFHAYTKGEIRDPETDARFCNRFNYLFDLMEERDSSAMAQGLATMDLPQSTTYVSLVYSIVKGNIMQHNGLLSHLAKGCLSNMESYEADEIANLTLAFSRIYKHYKPQSADSDETTWKLSASVLEAINKRLNEPALKFSAFSIRALSTLGIHDEDVIAVLNALKHNKHSRRQQNEVPSAYVTA
ncbi:hypothetical protein BgAZ_202430 [Babesia gibsoni]|uniref:RNA-editing substrate-binding complex 6 protein domain-containing protein n=1 Tax=Babesia gibsoni TaxID=33632 RepID=A0AAD8LRR4_BABGI|nr:hypothetical protein BgAZ_202430 [Babesia gibsoni]